MIDIDTSRLPTGSLGWAQLFEAIESALPSDETYWIEFKSGHDAASTKGKAAIAKAIVAFANRPPDLAQRWLEGHALIVLGVEPGKVPGAAVHDPATIHQTIQPLLAPPAPTWDLAYHLYKDKHVLVITVAPPRAGDPIAVIGKSSGTVEDGHVYVRRPGISERAKSADIRDLSSRLFQAHTPGLNVEVTAVPADGIHGVPVHEWPNSWIDEWIDEERRRVLKPLEDVERPKPSTANAGLMDGKTSVFESLAKLSADSSAAFGVTTTPEDRTPEQYREEVETYLAGCRHDLAGAEFDAALAVLPPLVWRVKNLTEHNLSDVKVTVHVEGEAEAFKADHEPPTLRARVGAALRLWGPRTSSRFSIGSLPSLGRIVEPPPIGLFGLSAPGPEITNGGSFNIVFPLVSLRAAAATELGEAVVILGSAAGSLRCTWTATATNVSGVIEGAFDLPIREERVSLSNVLRYRPPKPRGQRPGSQAVFADDDE